MYWSDPERPRQTRAARRTADTGRAPEVRRTLNPSFRPTGERTRGPAGGRGGRRDAGRRDGGRGDGRAGRAGGPKAFEREALDALVREARAPKVHDWLVNHVVRKSPHAEELPLVWTADPDPVVESAGWALTTESVRKDPGVLDLPGLLDVVEARMKDAPDRLRWAMNRCLARIGIDRPGLRARAVGIGERLEVLKDHPTSPGCTSPFTPAWIAEMVRRQDAS
ncbi:DNA alkylation repair protein [Streptomyces sp. McG3]|uniref:DNA alkylation repair protein n=1 Tax=Streptomyces sp. McG3 TaxID=2725483 RepID=UPI0035A9604B